MSSGRRYSLEQLMVESGRLQPAGSSSRPSSSTRSAVAQRRWRRGRGTGSHRQLLMKYNKARNLGVNLSWSRHQTWQPKVYQNRPKTETWA
eukprot:COSAG04_NODE_16629_length_493_cov_1.131980_1_plen_90_part_01